MIEVKILVDHINYESVAEFLVPLLAESMKNGEKGGILGSVLAGNPEMATNMARTILKTMSQEKKDELLLQMLAKHREKILGGARNAIGKKGIGVELCDISAKKV